MIVGKDEIMVEYFAHYLNTLVNIRYVNKTIFSQTQGAY